MFRFPNLEERLTINGRNGTGKTVAGAWILSEMPFDRQPFVILDFKDEGIFKQIERRIPIDLDEIPTKPGLFHLKALPTQEDKVERWLWEVWKQQEIGLFVDEGYLLPKNSDAYKAIQTTGRSRRIPTITLSQRPVLLPRHVFSEMHFYMSFHLNDKRDRDTVDEWTPDNDVWDQDQRLEKYHSRWYDISEDFSCILKPCPPVDRILERFDKRLKPRVRLI